MLLAKYPINPYRTFEMKRKNDHVNTPDIEKYFDKSTADYQRARELFSANENIR